MKFVACELLNEILNFDSKKNTEKTSSPRRKGRGDSDTVRSAARRQKSGMDLDDEFDIEIQDAVFDIDGENGDLEMVCNNESSRPSSIFEVYEVHQPGDDDDPDDNDEDGVDNNCITGTTEERGMPYHVLHTPRNDNPDIISRNGCPAENDANYTCEDLEMDDEYDVLLTQIDEKLMKTSSEDSNLAKSKISNEVASDSSNSFSTRNSNHVPKKSPAKRGYNLETSSFFMSQEVVADAIPLRRTFPGPAGLLPTLNTEEIKLLDSEPHPLCQKVFRIVKESSLKTEATKEKSVVGSKPSGGGRKLMINKAPWRTLLQKLDLNLNDENSLLHLLNIRWVRTKVKRFPGTVNVPFLVAVVRDEVEILTTNEKGGSKNLSCRLMDPSGTIVAAISSSFVEAFATKIIPGTAVAFRNCGVSKFKNQIILTVSKSSLLYLITAKKLDDEDEETTPTGKEFPMYKKENGLLIMQMAIFNKEKILEEYQNVLGEMNSAYEDEQNEIQENSVVHQQQQLFATISTRGHFMDAPTNAILSDSNVSNFNLDCSGFDDDDDDELMQAIENVNFLIEEESL
ncbi:hypothetical protein Ocin01_07865 [Orchesella cincta]|uniref:Uncharacterized protein n=1 Tax=Orchesella cincta TaxID=48709 RepID=A0A1D2N0T3_ORCCI|nr:hypothetical protein Ocin01_07865 [Orchesella cincta]